MTMRVKQVISSRMEGASESRVMAKRMRIPMSTSWGWSPPGN